MRWEAIVHEVRSHCSCMRWEAIVHKVRSHCSWGEKPLFMRWEAIVHEVRSHCSCGEKSFRTKKKQWKNIIVEWLTSRAICKTQQEQLLILHKQSFINFVLFFTNKALYTLFLLKYALVVATWILWVRSHAEINCSGQSRNLCVPEKCTFRFAEIVLLYVMALNICEVLWQTECMLWQCTDSNVKRTATHPKSQKTHNAFELTHNTAKTCTAHFNKLKANGSLHTLKEPT